MTVNAKILMSFVAVKPQNLKFMTVKDSESYETSVKVGSAVKSCKTL
jgi:hypothetical protein